MQILRCYPCSCAHTHTLKHRHTPIGTHTKFMRLAASSHHTRNKASYRGSNPSPDFSDDCLIAFLFGMHIDLVMANITFCYFCWCFFLSSFLVYERIIGIINELNDQLSRNKHPLHHWTRTPISIKAWTHDWDVRASFSIKVQEIIHTIKKHTRQCWICVFLIKNVDELFCDRLETFSKKSKLSCKTMKYSTTKFLSHDFDPMILEKM